MVPASNQQRVEQAEVERAVTTLLGHDGVAELRVLDAGEFGTMSGYYRDRAALCRDALRWSGHARSIFVTLNPVHASRLSVAPDRLISLLDETQEQDIVSRLWFPVDFDPCRPQGTNSTDSEHVAALHLARRVRDWLANLGWPGPVLADSGNGAHLLYRIDLPNDQEVTKLIENCLAALDLRFSNHLVTLDAIVSDAARLWKLYGTLVAKDKHTPERPERLSRILEMPARVDPVPAELLRGLLLAPHG